MLSRNNHYLPQMYLDAWTNNKNIQVYETLVPDKNVPYFQERNIRRVGSYDSMYVRVDNGEEIDDIEKMFSKEYETPAKEALTKAIKGENISQEELDKLIDFMTSIYVRTPNHIRKSLDIMKKSITNVDIEELPVVTKKDIVKNEDFISFPNKIIKIVPYDKDTSIVYSEMIIGKQAYLYTLLMNIKKYSEELKKKSWSIVSMDNSVSLPTSDNPLIIMNYKDKDHYTLDAGVNSPYSVIIFPISPNKVLMAQSGLTQEPKMKLNKKGSNSIKKIIIENANRIVLSKDKDWDITSIKPREVNLEKYLEEKEAWFNFQKNYLEEETKYFK